MSEGERVARLEVRLERALETHRSEVETLRQQLRRAEQSNWDLRNRAAFLESEHKRQEDQYEALRAQFQQLLRKVRAKRRGDGATGPKRVWG